MPMSVLGHWKSDLQHSTIRKGVSCGMESPHPKRWEEWWTLNSHGDRRYSLELSRRSTGLSHLLSNSSAFWWTVSDSSPCNCPTSTYNFPSLCILGGIGQNAWKLEESQCAVQKGAGPIVLSWNIILCCFLWISLKILLSPKCSSVCGPRWMPVDFQNIVHKCISKTYWIAKETHDIEI